MKNGPSEISNEPGMAENSAAREARKNHERPLFLKNRGFLDKKKVRLCFLL